MLKIYDYNDDNNLLPLILQNDKWYITHKYSGFDTLTFEIDSTDKMYRHIAEEVKIIANDNQYIIKKIDEHSTFVTVNCDLDFDDWKKSLFANFRKTDILLSDVFDIIKPPNWTIINATLITLHTTVEESENSAFTYATPFDILNVLEDAYNCVFTFDTIKKTVTVSNPTQNTATGDYFSDELNLKSIGYTGNSENFATRLYAYGKKDEITGEALTFKDINNNKEYVENNSYSNKVICAYWSDERYTIKENLLNDAKEKLAEMAIPVRSYTCDAYNLEEGVWLYKVVTLIDRKRKMSVNHQIVEFKEYPEAKYLNSITLSAVAQTIKSTVDSVKETAKKEIKKNNDYMQGVLNDAVKKATEEITKNKGGAFYLIYDSDGKLQEIVNLADTEDINTAQSVWRWNASGLGHSNNGYAGVYDLALLHDGSINANMITTGELNANLIKTGVLEVKDENGNTLFSVNMETGKVIINNGRFRVARTYNASYSLGDWMAKADVTESAEIYDSYLEIAKTSEVHGTITKRYGADGLHLSAVHATGLNAYPNSYDGAVNARYLISSKQDGMTGQNLVCFGWCAENENDEDWKKNCTKFLQPLWINNRLYTTNSIVFGTTADDERRMYGYKSGDNAWVEVNSAFKVLKQLCVDGALKVGASGDTKIPFPGTTVSTECTLYNLGMLMTRDLKATDTLSASDGDITRFTCRTISVTSGKMRIVDTDNYNVRELHCYEMASPLFGDIGTGTLDENGECIVMIDDIFSETVLLKQEYFVFLQKEGCGDVWIDKKELNYFIVKGTPFLKFAWELKAKQKGLDDNNKRLNISAQSQQYKKDSTESIYESELSLQQQKVKYYENDLIFELGAETE